MHFTPENSVEKNEIGLWFRSWRERLRMSVAEVSQIAKTSPEELEKFERGSASSLCATRLAVIYQISPEVLAYKIKNLPRDRPNEMAILSGVIV